MKPPRQRYLRAFDQWLTSISPSLPARPRAVHRDRHHLVYRIEGYPDALELVVAPGDLSIRISHEGRLWDMLVAIESAAESVAGGYRCALCPLDDFRWPDRAALWIEHDFLALAEWLRSTLAPAGLLDLHQLGGMTWADLMPVQTAPSPTLAMRYRLPGHGRLA